MCATFCAWYMEQVGSLLDPNNQDEFAEDILETYEELREEHYAGLGTIPRWARHRLCTLVFVNPGLVLHVLFVHVRGAELPHTGAKSYAFFET
jgi:hypothetical protein